MAQATGPQATGVQSTGVQSAGAEIEQGHAAFVAKGCYECHGLAGQGARGVAPTLARSRLPLSAFQAYVHKPGGQMPPYSAKVATDPELEGIYAYLQSMPASRNASSIPLLAAYVAGSPGPLIKARSVAAAPPAQPAATSAEGAGVFRQNCAACHGADLEGGVGPSLQAEASKRTVAQIAAFVKDPAPPMPKLPLTQHDLEAVAAYIHGHKS